MPKVKTKSGAKKRFKVTGSGKVKHKRAFKNHILTKKGTKQKRRLGKKSIVTAGDMKNVRFMIPHAL
jgi:large subunit ribosomal protein L35